MASFIIPPNPRIYHIVHVRNLASVLADGYLYSDAKIIERGGPKRAIGMGNIKRRRLALPVSCYPDTTVGQFVPFYFCPRSIMLYVLHCADNPELAYRDGQGPIVHLEADLYEVIAAANKNKIRWAFSSANAAAHYATFHNEPADLDKLNWPAIANRDFRSSEVKEAKQSEFLVHGSFPWHLVRRVGVHSRAISQQAADIMSGCGHRPPIEICSDWYY